MELLLLRTAFYLILVSPILIFCRNKSNKNLPSIFIFIAFVLFNAFLLGLPGTFPNLKFGLDLSWNWFGKLYAIFGSILFLLVYKKQSPKDLFITLKQNPVSLKASLIITGLVIILSIGLGLLGGKKDFNLETLMFQLTMPGFDEEIAFRGIMLGLLIPVLNDKITVGKIKLGNPAVLVTALLFGFVHSLFITKEFNIDINLVTLISTGFYGYILAWLTKKSGSILFPIIIHNLGNFLPFFISMIIL